MNFSQQVSEFRKNALTRSEKIQKVTKIELFGSIIKDTPVLDGFLRSAWQASYASPNLAKGNAADKSGADTISKMTVVVNASSQDGTLYFSNPLPHGPRIEYKGHSSVKAPQGMVRKNIARFQGIVDTAIISTSRG